MVLPGRFGNQKQTRYIMQKLILGALCASALAFSAVSGVANTGQDNPDGTASGKAADMRLAQNTSEPMDHGMHAAPQVQLGDLTLSAPFTRATPPNAPVAGGFVTIANAGAEADRLVSARADDVAGRMEIHEMAMEGDVMKMRELPDGLSIPAGESVELKPGGYHIMFMELKKPLVEGEVVNVTLVFENAGEIELPFAVGPRNASMGDAGHGDEHAGH